MRFQISHATHYQYDVAVRLAPHVVRLSPRSGEVRLVHQRLDVAPLPLARSQRADDAGNVSTYLEFSGETRSLRIDSQLELETLTPEPLEHWLSVLTQLRPAEETGLHPDVHAFASRLAQDTSYQPVAFLDRLNHTLFTRMERYVRHEGPARPAHETLALGGGACRDLTVLFLEACRHWNGPEKVDSVFV